MIENRQAERRPAFALTEVRHGEHKPLTGLIYNISQDGAFILTNTTPPVAECVSIRMPYIKENNKVVWIHGKVTHRNYVGFGLMFESLDEDICRIVRTVSAV